MLVTDLSFYKIFHILIFKGTVKVEFYIHITVFILSIQINTYYKNMGMARHHNTGKINYIQNFCINTHIFINMIF